MDLQSVVSQLESLLNQVKRIMLTKENSSKVEPISRKKYFTVAEASEYLGVSKAYLYKLSNQKVLPTFKPGKGRVFFLIADLDSYLESGKVMSNDEIELESMKYYK